LLVSSACHDEASMRRSPESQLPESQLPSAFAAGSAPLGVEARVPGLQLQGAPHFANALACAESKLRLHFSTLPIDGCERGFDENARSALVETEIAPEGRAAAGTLRQFEPMDQFSFHGASRGHQAVALEFETQTLPTGTFIRGTLYDEERREGHFLAPLFVVERSVSTSPEPPAALELSGALFGRDFEGGSVLALFEGAALSELRFYPLAGLSCSEKDSAIHVRVAVSERAVRVHSLFWSDKKPVVVPRAVQLNEHSRVDVIKLELDAARPAQPVHGDVELTARWGRSRLRGRFQALACDTSSPPSVNPPPHGWITPLTPAKPQQFSAAPARGMLGSRPFVVKSALAMVDAASKGAVRELRLYALPKVSCANAEDAVFLRLAVDATPNVKWTAIGVGATVAVQTEQVAPFFDEDLGRWRTQSVEHDRGVVRWDSVDAKAQKLRVSVFSADARLDGVINAVVCES
jgi:hypothetical protein